VPGLLSLAGPRNRADPGERIVLLLFCEERRRLHRDRGSRHERRQQRRASFLVDQLGTVPVSDRDTVLVSKKLPPFPRRNPRPGTTGLALEKLSKAI
jgi:hypothetical protein